MFELWHENGSFWPNFTLFGHFVSLRSLMFKGLTSSRALCPRFSVCFGIPITSLGEEGAGIYVSRTFVCLFCACMFLSFFSSSWRRWLAAVCDCGIPWIFLLTFL